MQLITMKLGENKRHMILLFNIRLKVIYTFNHNNLLITTLKVFWFPISSFPKKLFNVAWPPPAGIGRHNDASSTNKTFKTEWAEFVGSYKQYCWFCSLCFILQSIWSTSKKKFVFTISVKIRFSSEKYCALSWQYYKVKWQELLTSRMHLIMG